jgi:hypothetical protein
MKLNWIYLLSCLACTFNARVLCIFYPNLCFLGTMASALALLQMTDLILCGGINSEIIISIVFLMLYF